MSVGPSKLCCNLLVMLVVAIPSPAAAQTVVGHVLDSLTAAPVHTAAVMLLDSVDVAVAVVETDSLGRFELQAPRPGRYRVYADRLAYEEVFSEDLVLRSAGTLELLVRLVPLPVELDPLTVTAEGRLVKLEELGFYRRRDWAPGYECTMKLVVDNSKVDTIAPLDDLVHPDQVIGIEVYPSGVGAPIHHRGTDAFCGIVVVWTR